MSPNLDKPQKACEDGEVTLVKILPTLLIFRLGTQVVGSLGRLEAAGSPEEAESLALLASQLTNSVIREDLE